MNTEKTFADRLKELRNIRNYTQEELGKITNISVQSIRRYEQGRLNEEPRAYNLLQLAKALDVTPEYLLIGDNNMTSYTEAIKRELKQLNDYGQISEIKETELNSTILSHLEMSNDLVDAVKTDWNAKGIFKRIEKEEDKQIVVELTKDYDGHIVFQDAHFTIEKGEKVAFVGRNGEGKSTLVKCIMGEIPYTGKLTLGYNVKIGYFAQNQASLMDESLTVFQTIDDVTPLELKHKIKDMLGAFMFSGDDIDKKVKVLSGGERTRLAMIKLLLSPVNLLILDEPTNHLDLRTKDILKNALKEFDGTLIVVSHDRDFLTGLVHKVYEFGNKKVKEHLEDIQGFLRKKKMENLREIERKNG